ncbi:MAG: T9SS type A sorting domain-containing protein [Flavobacteriales bacterium]|nr:T9SS type A sorting domain-containing protein [Flavobacteriales bacterium]
MNSNAFVAKYDAAGNAIWAKSAGGSGNERGNGIAVVSEDIVYVTGTFDSPSLPLGPETLVNSGSNDVFVARMNRETGIADSQATDGLSVSPNPLSDRTTVRTAQPMTNATLTLINDLGHTVKVVPHMNGSSVTVLRDQLPAGIYILQIWQGGKWMASEKIVIMD